PHRVVGPAIPQRLIAGPHEGVERHIGLDAPRLAIGDGGGQLLAGEIEAGEVARIGFVAEAAIDRVGPGIDGFAIGGRGSGGTDQFHLTPTPPAPAAGSLRLRASPAAPEARRPGPGRGADRSRYRRAHCAAPAWPPCPRRSRASGKRTWHR